MTRKPRVGLLPFYLKLYDDSLPQCRKGFAPFLSAVEKGFAARGLEVVPAPVCRIRPEFEKAVAAFRTADVDCVITVHLAYSPSLESVGAMARLRVPLIILDTTMDEAFDQRVSPARIMYNHGVHGVMDFASMLRRNGVPFSIVAGHYRRSKVLDRAADLARAAFAARELRTTRALRIGESFRGMGDFSVDEAVMRRTLGIRVKQMTVADLARAMRAVTPAKVAAELAADRKRFRVTAPKAVHARSVRISLGLRRLLEAGAFGAFSMNFLAFDGRHGVDTLPFLEASKGMARGIGYGGEGDVLTAALVGALQRAFGGTTFTEVFCPDWKGGTVFLSHMGEINPVVAAGKATLVEKPFLFPGTKNPAIVTCAMQTGPAVFVNLVPGPRNTFSLVLAPVTVLPDSKRKDMVTTVRGWIRPAAGLEAFLEAYSRHGGTHHSALVLGDKREALEQFARYAGFEVVVIG